MTGAALSGAGASGGMADRVAQLEARVARLEAALGDLLPDEDAAPDDGSTG
jgi:hypothetical protein